MTVQDNLEPQSPEELLPEGEEGELSADGAADDRPQEGDVLEPGDYLVELATSTPVRREVVSEGLQAIGFSEAWHDLSLRRDAAFPVREHRIACRLTRAVQIHQQERVRWMLARQIGTNVFREVKDLRHETIAFDLVPHMMYEALFLSSPPPPALRGVPLRQVVEQTLGEMGFIPHKLMGSRRDVRHPPTGRTGEMVSLWFAILEWDGPMGFVTSEDPFYFEELNPLG